MRPRRPTARIAYGFDVKSLDRRKVGLQRNSCFAAFQPSWRPLPMRQKNQQPMAVAAQPNRLLDGGMVM